LAARRWRLIATGLSEVATKEVISDRHAFLADAVLIMGEDIAALPDDRRANVEALLGNNANVSVHVHCEPLKGTISTWLQRHDTDECTPLSNPKKSFLEDVRH
jgi:hypothetical protein